MDDISVILNVYKRSHTLEYQIDAIKQQTVPILDENIHVWYNFAGIDQPLPKNNKIKTYRCNWNTKFFGRFTIPLLLQTKYIAMFDDDVLPQKRWFENCLNTMQTNNGILGGTGPIIRWVKRHKKIPGIKRRGTEYRLSYDVVGWNFRNSDKIEKVDFVGHAWFFQTEWSKYFWYEKPYSMDNCEDMHFSYMCQKYGNISTFVPPHPLDNKEIWSSCPDFGRLHGCDRNASSGAINFWPEREKITKDYINSGWRLVIQED